MASTYVWLRGLLLRQDAEHDYYCRTYQAHSLLGRVGYLFMYLAPGIVGFVAINIEPVYSWLREASGLQDRWLQYAMFIVVTYLWHIAWPFVALMWLDKLSFGGALRFLGLNRVDWTGVLVVMPLVLFVPYTLLSIPYFYWVIGPLEAWLWTVPVFQMPEYSIFKAGLYDFPALALLFLFLGNFLGEELYYRGYLMKKTAFLGKHNWWVSSMLFAVYHFWQVPQTWPLILPAVIFGLMMVWRKDLYVVIGLHFLLNLVWLPLMYGGFVPPPA